MIKLIAIYKSIAKYIEIRISIDFIITALSFSLGTLLPTHWFWHWDPAWSYWSGIQMEPWVPKVFVSTLLIAFLWSATLLRFFLNISPRGRRAEWPRFRQFSFLADQVLIQKLCLSGLLAFIAVLGSINFSLVPQAAMSFWLQTLTGPGLLAVWIWLMYRTPARSALWRGILIGVGIQAALAWWQVLTQSALGGYWLLGQPNFSSVLLAKSDFSQAVRVLPYGSTPHPNVLASWLVLGLVLIWQEGFFSGQWKKIAGSALILFPLSWTESWSAWLTLGILLLVPRWWHATRSRKWLRWGSALLLWVVMTGSVIWLPRLIPSWQLNPSFARREVQLMAAPRLLVTSPLGWGPVQHPIGYSPEEKRELRSFSNQPIHAAGIAGLVDMGVWTLFLLSAFLIIVHKKYSYFVPVFLISLPIFSLDHFGYSTISGQYLLILFMLFFAEYHRFK